MILKSLHLFILLSISILLIPLSACMAILGFIYTLIYNQFLNGSDLYLGLCAKILELNDDIFKKKKAE